MLLHDRTYAAFLLEDKLRHYKHKNAVVLAIPRGGVPIGYQLSRLLGLPLDIIISKKIPHPLNPEFAVGSVCGEEVILDDTGKTLPQEYLQKQIERLIEEEKTRYQYFRGGHPPIELKGKIAILVDDGIATGDTVLSAIKKIRKQKPAKIVLAVPVASTTANQLLAPVVDEFVCLLLPFRFSAVGEFYENFSEVTDEEVIHYLQKSEPKVSA
jgi:putative phosphoribosyl transferase